MNSDYKYSLPVLFQKGYTTRWSILAFWLAASQSTAKASLTSKEVSGIILNGEITGFLFSEKDVRYKLKVFNTWGLAKIFSWPFLNIHENRLSILDSPDLHLYRWWSGLILKGHAWSSHIRCVSWANHSCDGVAEASERTQRWDLIEFTKTFYCFVFKLFCAYFLKVYLINTFFVVLLIAFIIT